MCEGSHFVQNAIHMAPRPLNMIRSLAARGYFLHRYAQNCPSAGCLQAFAPHLLVFDADASGTPLGAPGPAKRL